MDDKVEALRAIRRHVSPMLPKMGKKAARTLADSGSWA
jgi:hypothetical protein